MREIRRALPIIILGMLICMTFSGTFAAQQSTPEKPRLIVVASEEAYKLSQGVINFIKGRGVPVLHVTTSEFNEYKTNKEKPDYRKEKYILILGGANESNGTGDLIKEVLTQEEVEWVSKTGNKKMYLKTDKWCKSQYILVFAGYDIKATYKALVDNKDDWWAYMRGWFDIEPTDEELYGY